MPSGPRIRANNVYGLITDNPLTSVATTMNSTGLSVLPAVSSAHSIIVLDPKRIFGEPEIVVVTAHSALSTSATITRAAYGTVARSHPMNTAWAHVAVTEDYVEIVTSVSRPLDPYIGEIIFETDTVSYQFWNGSAWTSFGSGGGGGAATLGYAQLTSHSQDVTTNPTDITGLSVTVTVPAGRRLRITGKCHLANTLAAGDQANLTVKEGSTNLNTSYGDFVNNNVGVDVMVQAIVSPTAGTHTYKLSSGRNSGDGVLTAFAGGGPPPTVAFILVEDITDSQAPFANPNVPVGTLAFAQAPASNQTFTTAVTVTGCSVNVVVPAGRTIRVSGQVQYSPATAANEISLRIKEDGVIVKLVQETGDTVGRTYDIPISHILSPTAAAHTYLLEVERTIGAGSDTVVNTSARAAYILVEDITPTPASGTGAPSSTLGYAQTTVDQTGISAEVNLTGLSVNVTVPDGRRLKITGFIPQYTRTAGTATFADLRIYEGATRLQQETAVMNNLYNGVTVTVVISPAAGNHTYNLKGASDGTVTLEAQSDFPAFILVEDITGALWPAGGQVTAGLIASEAWTTYVPTNVGITLGNGVETARYMKIGRTVHVVYELVFGTTTAFTSDVSIGLPVPALGAGTFVGAATYLDASTSVRHLGSIRRSGTGSGQLNHANTGLNVGVVNPTSPITWTTSDNVWASWTYEAAS